MGRIILIILLLGLLAAGVVGAGSWYMNHNKPDGPRFKYAPVKQGDVISTISATGTVEPQEVVDVGAQVAGIINSFGPDKNGKPIDYGSVVEKDMVLAEIDQSLYSADVASAQAQLAQDKAAVVRAQADLGQMKAKLIQADNDWKRAQALGPGDALAQQAYDGYLAAYETAKANVAVDEAAIVQANATVDKDVAELNRCKQNIDYCTIKSPVNGVIIDRRVNIGQTVVSSLNAPSLFLIAKDLTKMQVWVSVNEADIGNIHSGQPVTFTVDAFPGKTFHGTVGKVRLNATMTQNVVIYTVEVETDNSDGKLLPYLTANVQFEVGRHENVLTVPNAALRWVPKLEIVAPDVRAAMEKRQAETKPHESTTVPATTNKSDGEEMTKGRLWIEDGEFVRPIRVKAGLSDGVVTEVQAVKGDELKEDMQIINGDQVTTVAPTGETNPFAPAPRRH